MKLRGNKLLKKIDRYIGIPIVFFLGCLCKKQNFQRLSAKPRIVLLKTNAIGDAILLSAVIQELRGKYPGAQITVVCGKTNQNSVELLDGVDEIFCFAMGSPLKSLLAVRALGKFDVLFDFGPWMRINALIAACMKVNFKVGFKRRGMYRHYAYDAVVEHRDDLHELENYRNILRCAGVSPRGFMPRIMPEIESDSEDGDIVVFHPFPGGSMQIQRKWPLEKWCELGKIISKKRGNKICISGGREDVSEALQLCEALQKRGVSVDCLAGKANLKDMVRILANSCLLVSVNTGIMHLGAATGTPIVALHGATDPKRWGPLSNRAIVVQSGEPCQPCISLGFESTCTDPVCMEHITVEQVWKAVRVLLEKETEKG